MATTPLIHQGPVAIAFAWFPPDQRASALERWPDLAEDFEDPQAYALRLERHLRDADLSMGKHPSVAPINVAAFVAWAESEDHDPGDGRTRSVYAADLLRGGRAVAWPPGRNDACWCRSGRKYKRCCGAS